MTWVRLDDKFLTHPKIVRAGKDARDLYLAGLFYSSGNLTDGFLPSESLPMLAATAIVDDPHACAERLIALRLWEATDGGYAIHDYLDYQPSSESVRAERAASTRRVQQWRAQQRNAPSNAVTDGVGNAVGNAPVTVPPYPSRSRTHPGPGNVPDPVTSPPESTTGEPSGGVGGLGDSAAASAAPPTIRAVPKSRKSTGTDLGPLIEAFGALGLPRPNLADPAEQHAAGVLLKTHPPPDLARCWQDFAAGDYGDAYDQRHLSFLHLSKLERVANWRRWRDGEHGQSPGTRANGRGAQPRPAGSPSPFAKYGRT